MKVLLFFWLLLADTDILISILIKYIDKGGWSRSRAEVDEIKIERPWSTMINGK